MCDQWNQNSSLLDVSGHVLSCAKCLYRKLDQFKEATEENKGKMSKMKAIKDRLKKDVDLLAPNSHNYNIIVDRMRALDVDVAYLEEKLQLVESQVQDIMSIVNMSIRAQKSKWNSLFNRRK